jgi:hydrogenase-4 membrane subunit HyfE
MIALLVFAIIVSALVVTLLLARAFRERRIFASDAELVARHVLVLTAKTDEFSVALATMVPSVQRATKAMDEFARVLAKSAITEDCR